MSDKQLEIMLRRLRKEYPGFTIILPQEKEYVPMHKIDAKVRAKAHIIKIEYDVSLKKWKSTRLHTRVTQVKEDILIYYRFDDKPEVNEIIGIIIEEVLEMQG